MLNKRRVFAATLVLLLLFALAALPALAASPGISLGSFETDSQEGWTAGANVSTLNTLWQTPNLTNPSGSQYPSAYSGRKLLDATCNAVAANATKYVNLSYGTGQNWSTTPVLSFAISSYGGAPNATAYTAYLSVTGGGSSVSQTWSMSPNAWNKFSYDLSSFSGLSSISQVSIGFSANSSPAWGCHFQIDAIGLQDRGVWQQTLGDFENDALDGWVAGTNVTGVARTATPANQPKTCRRGWYCLEATLASVAANLDHLVSSTFSAQDWTSTPVLSYYVDVYGGAPGATAYYAKATISSGSQSVSYTQRISSDAWNLVKYDLTGWANLNAVTGVTISVYTDSSQVWGGRFQLDDVERRPGTFPVFSSSDATAAANANSMLWLHWHSLPGPGPATGDGQTDWREWDSLALSPVNSDANRVVGADFNAALRSNLLNLPMVSDPTYNTQLNGYVFMYNVDGGYKYLWGWPFPTYSDSNGNSTGWTFNNSSQNFTLTNASSSSFSGDKWVISTPSNDPQIISPSALSINAYNCPYIAVRMANQNTDTTGQVYFSTGSGFTEAHSVKFTVSNDGTWNTYYVPMYTNAGWSGTITQIRLDPVLSGGTGGLVGLEFLDCAYDTQHSTTNSNFILGSARYFYWHPADVAFLQANIGRMRTAMHFLQNYLGLDANNYLVLPWWGHDGTSGSSPTVRYGYGLGSNYWDLLPAGYKDLQGTIYAYAAEKAMADIEALIAANPSWGIAANPYGETSTTFTNKAASVYNAVVNGSTFWNATTGRYAISVDVNGVAHDYGYTFTNLEALYYGLGNSSQANNIYGWLTGTRTVSGDTSQGADIYAFTFAPRATTLRNGNWYYWGWNPPAFGTQVQDGGAVLYTTFYDLLNRITYRGADDAYSRFQAVLNWYQAAQTAGGYRAYYASKGIQMQGCGTAGGVGIDCEFVESTLVPLAFLYGFMGVNATKDGLVVSPHLPSTVTWDQVDNLSYNGNSHSIKVTGTGIQVTPVISTGSETLKFGNVVAGNSYSVTKDGSAFTTLTADSNGFITFSTSGTGTHTYAVSY